MYKRQGNALAESQFVRVWKYIAVRSTEERCYCTYVNGQKIKHVVKDVYKRQSLTSSSISFAAFAPPFS